MCCPDMKAVILVPISCVLVGLTVWLALRRNADVSHGSEAGSAQGTRRASLVSAAEATNQVKTRSKERPAPPSETEMTVRNLLSQRLLKPDGGGLDIEATARLRKQLDGMTTEEILEALLELDARDPRTTGRGQIASFMASTLGRRDPRLALDAFVGRISYHPVGMTLQLGAIYATWASKDVSAAAEWLDRQIAEEKFSILAGSDGRRVDPLTQFESVLVRAQAIKDPVAASARFAAMTDGARAEALRGDDWFARSDPESWKAMADFLRAQSNDSATILATTSSQRLRQGNLEDTGRFLDALEPAPAERSAMVAEALRGRLTGQDELRTSPQEARAWILQQAPEDADRLTGTALAQFVEWNDFSEMAGLATGYRDESGTDEVLVAFLKSAPVGHRTAILEMAAGLSDSSARAEIAKRFDP